MEELKIQVGSEIGDLEAVIMHTPGSEVENMTPENAERALYSDILNLSIAQKEFAQLKGVLQSVCDVYEVKQLLTETIGNETAKDQLLAQICENKLESDLYENLSQLSTDELAKQMIEGVEISRNNLTRFLSDERFALRPLHNLFFTRDASMSVWDNVLIGKMASKVRDRETMVMQSIFSNHPKISTTIISPNHKKTNHGCISIEGGDVQIINEDILLIGKGLRTTTQGIDFIIDQLKSKNDKVKHIVVQELPSSPESFIHLDMAFTCLDRDKCMVYKPLLLDHNKYQTIHIEIDNGDVKKIGYEKNVISALSKLGVDLEPVFCGGKIDQWNMEREQWHSGANFFAFAPGKVIGYERNRYTVDELSNHGFAILKAQEVIEKNIDLKTFEKVMVTIEGSELARGGGGARCMTMPIKRKPLVF